MVETVEVALSDQIREYADQNYTYGWRDFAAVAEENGWPSIDMICDPLGSPVGSSTSPRDYQYVAHAYAIGASNAEAIESALDETAEEEWVFGPGGFFVFNASHEGITEVARGLEGSLASYGVINDERCSELEWDENHPSETECYSSDPDCGCPKALHACRDQLLAAVESGTFDLTAEEYWCDFCEHSNDMTKEERAYVSRALYPPRKWWQYTRKDFCPERTAEHEAEQRRVKEAEAAWKALGQAPLF